MESQRAARLSLLVPPGRFFLQEVVVIRHLAASLIFLAGGVALRAQIPQVEHTFIVVEENQDFGCVIGNPARSWEVKR